jgi:hypothetical protein
VNGLEPPYEMIVDALLSGSVVPFFGSVASAIVRPPNAPAWDIGRPYFPSGAELAAILARASKYDAADAAYKAAEADLVSVATDAAMKVLPGANLGDIGGAIQAAIKPVLSKYFTPGLALIASYYSQVQGTRKMLEGKLHQAFDVAAEPGALHKRLAGIDAIQLYVTTNYDDLVERALERRRPHILVDRLEKGLTLDIESGAPELIGPTGADLEERLADPETGKPTRPILFKMHGSVDRKNRTNDRYLITEDDYVDYLGRDQGKYIPPYIESLMRGNNILFLGYSLEDWNIRVILRKLLVSIPSGRPSEETEEIRFWAIVQGRSDAEQRIWQHRNLNIYPMDLREFTERLAAELDRRG